MYLFRGHGIAAKDGTMSEKRLEPKKCKCGETPIVASGFGLYQVSCECGELGPMKGHSEARAIWEWNKGMRIKGDAR